MVALTRRDLLTATVAGAAGCRWLTGGRTGGPPNVVLILTDDQGYNDIGCYASPDQDPGDEITTPHLDRMAAEGARFTSFYVAAPTCSPSRAAILTGRYPPRCGFVEDTNLGPGHPGGLPSSEVTVAEVLRGAGYVTGIVGKWHLGVGEGMMPLAQGFDRFFGVPWSNNQHPLPLMEGDQVLRRLPDKPILVEEFTREALAFIALNRDRPFFLYLAHTAPHAPLALEPEYRGRSARGLYGDVIQRIDWSVGEILAALRAHGIEENTLVVFTSDNGPWVNKGYKAGDARPYRGGKGSSLEGGMREPLIVRWPEHVLAGRVLPELCSSLDFLPTFAARAGAALPAVTLDGHDLWPLLTDPSAKTAYEVFFYLVEGRLEAVRDARFKLRMDVPERARFDIRQALFELDADPREEHDVSAEHPDVVARLLSRARALEAELGLPGRPG